MAAKLLTLSFLAATVLAKTDIAGCTSSAVMITPSGRDDIYPYPSNIWYLPDTGEICEFLDCGGGRAPPKTDVPGCAAYEGTDTYSPKFLPSSTTASTPSATGDADAPEVTDDGDADEGAGGSDEGTDATDAGGSDSSSSSGSDGEAAETGGESTPTTVNTPNAAPAPTAIVRGILAAGVAVGLGMI